MDEPVSAQEILARMRHDFSDGEAGEEPYFKVEDAIPAGELATLESTFSPLEERSMLESARLILRFYKQVAPPLGQAHGIRYPVELERMMTGRLERLAAGRR